MITLAQMESIFLTALGFKDGDMDPADIDVYLNKIYQIEIPNKVPGSDYGYVDFTPITGLDFYPYSYVQPSNQQIRSITGPIFLLGSSQSEVELFTDPDEFVSRFPTATTGDVLGILVHMRWIRLRPIPSTATKIRIYGHFFNPQIPVAGLSNDIAWPVIHGAVKERADDLGRDDVSMRYDLKYKDGLAQLATMYASETHKPKPPGDRW